MRLYDIISDIINASALTAVANVRYNSSAR